MLVPNEHWPLHICGGMEFMDNYVQFEITQRRYKFYFECISLLIVWWDGFSNSMYLLMSMNISCGKK
jgi:hypothetical protein